MAVQAAGVEIKGISEAATHLRRLASAAQGHTRYGLYQAGQVIRDDARSRLTQRGIQAEIAASLAVEDER